MYFVLASHRGPPALPPADTRNNHTPGELFFPDRPSHGASPMILERTHGLKIRGIGGLIVLVLDIWGDHFGCRIAPGHRIEGPLVLLINPLLPISASFIWLIAGPRSEAADALTRQRRRFPGSPAAPVPVRPSNSGRLGLTPHPPGGHPARRNRPEARPPDPCLSRRMVVRAELQARSIISATSGSPGPGRSSACGRDPDSWDSKPRRCPRPVPLEGGPRPIVLARARCASCDGPNRSQASPAVVTAVATGIGRNAPLQVFQTSARHRPEAVPPPAGPSASGVEIAPEDGRALCRERPALVLDPSRRYC